MQAIYSPVIATVLLIQAVLGCCWQRALPAFVADRAAEPDTVCTCCQPSPTTAPTPERSDTSLPGGCRWECHGVCVYLAEKTSLDRSLSISDFADVAWHPASSPATFSAAMERSHLVDVLSPGPPPTRLHLLHQILLI